MPTPTDFYDIDSVLAEEERAVRESVRQFVDDKVLPIIGKCYVDGRFPKELIPEMASLGVLGANLPEPQQRRVRPDHAGARARRLGHSIVRVGAGRARHVSHLRLRLR